MPIFGIIAIAAAAGADSSTVRGTRATGSIRGVRVLEEPYAQVAQAFGEAAWGPSGARGSAAGAPAAGATSDAAAVFVVHLRVLFFEV